MKLLLFFFPFAVAAQSFPPTSGPMGKANTSFHDDYNQWVANRISSFGDPTHPVMVLSGDSLHFLFKERHQSQRIVPPAYHQLKAIDHLALGLFSLLNTWPEGPISKERLIKLQEYRDMTGQINRSLDSSKIENQDIQTQRSLLEETIQFLAAVSRTKQNEKSVRDGYAKRVSPLLLKNVEAAAKLQVTLLHSAVSTWRKELDSASFKSLYVVIASSHQARYRQLSIQYFDKVFHEKSGVTALTENHVVVAEGISDTKGCLSLLARHLIDQEIGISFFGDKYRMQRDLLSDGAAKFIDPLFAH